MYVLLGDDVYFMATCTNCVDVCSKFNALSFTTIFGPVVKDLRVFIAVINAIYFRFWQHGVRHQISVRRINSVFTDVYLACASNKVGLSKDLLLTSCLCD